MGVVCCAESILQIWKLFVKCHHLLIIFELSLNSWKRETNEHEETEDKQKDKSHMASQRNQYKHLFIEHSGDLPSPLSIRYTGYILYLLFAQASFVSKLCIVTNKQTFCHCKLMLYSCVTWILCDLQWTKTVCAPYNGNSWVNSIVEK